MIAITLDKRSRARVEGMLRAADARVARGEELFLLEIAGVLRREVQEAAPKVATGRRGRQYKYTQHLQLTGVEGMPHAEAAVAVWIKRSPAELRQEDLMRTALLVRPVAGAPRWVRALAGVGLWPADLLPVRLTARQASVVARRVRPDEAQALRQGIWGRRAQIADQLAAAGAPPFELGRAAAAGQRVYVDLAWEALRNEFGWGDAPAHAVWRGALRKMMAHVPEALRKFADYLMDGNEGRFDVVEADSVAWRKVQTGLEFQKVLKPFVSKRVRAR